MTPNSIRLEDNRLSFLIGDGNDADSVHRWASNDVRMNEGPVRMGVHRWSISPQCFTPELRKWLIQQIGQPRVIDGESVEDYRSLLANLRSRLEPMLPRWTWHLEVDNKTDRMGWYIRAPESWCSLFTIFVGLGWNSQISARGFLLFERAPPGELDRPDEAEANRLDGLRTVALCNGHRGALSHLANNMEWASSTKGFKLSLPGDVELWPPSMGRWPLLHGRSSSITFETRRRVGERRPRDGYESENEETILVEDTLDLSDAASRERLSRYRVTSSEMALVSRQCETSSERSERWC